MNEYKIKESGKDVWVTTKQLEDPKEKYPAPPFDVEIQEWPGLASKMDPRPDHGEKSYRGT